MTKADADDTTLIVVESAESCVGRSLEFEPSEALQKAMMVFWNKGFGRTSVDDLEVATGVGRKSLYRAFKDKRDLFLRALASYRAMMTEQNLQPLLHEDAGVAEIDDLLKRLVTLAATPMGTMGCLICNTALELGRDDSDAAAQVDAYLAQIRNACANALGRAVARGELALDEAAVDREANLLLGVVQGLCVLARAGARPETMTDIAVGAMQRLR